MIASVGMEAFSKLTSIGLIVVLMGSCTTVGAPNVLHGKAEIGLEQVLSLPISKGHAGVDEIVRTVHEWYGLDPDTALNLSNTAAPVALTDGTVISRVTISQTGSGIGIAVARQPCFSVERAVALTGAQKMSEPNGGSHYDAYVFANQDIDISFDAPEPGRACVADLYVRKKFAHR